MYDNVRPVFKRLTENWRGEGVVNDQRNVVLMRKSGKPLNVQNSQRRIGKRFPEHRFCIGLERFADFLVGGILSI